ncbi:hypothetical protein T492DRAFT_1059327 [Pavlovales sp. CCMP2436]|nr:hypothetical protein T492DRAFT_1059327 [Pavlovales sp. CCMP2436]
MAEAMRALLYTIGAMLSLGKLSAAVDHGAPMAGGLAPMAGSRRLLRLAALNSSLSREFRVESWQPVSPWLSRDAFDVELPPACTASVVACGLRTFNTRAEKAGHFPHSAQNLLPCWSFFSAHKRLKPVLLVESPALVGSSSWTRGLLELMGCEIATSLPPACAIVGTLRAFPPTGWPSNEMRWVSTPSDLPSLAGRFERSSLGSLPAMPQPSGARSIRVGLLLRTGGRRFAFEQEIVARIREALPRARLNATTFDNLSFIEQAAWLHSHDLILSAHGAQNMNFIFARKCASILEVFPPRYYLPGFYLTAAQAAGAVTFVAFSNAEEARTNPPASGLSKKDERQAYKSRRRSRHAALEISPESMARALQLMLKAHCDCVRRGRLAAPLQCGKDISMSATQ